MDYTNDQKIWISLRLSMGWLWFWAFIDKLFGLEFATKPENAWLLGGSPTLGFLKFGTEGKILGSIFQSIAGNPVVDTFFMIGLLTVGISLLLGIFVRIGSYIGALMALSMFAALIVPANNPLIDEHIIYVLVFYALAHSHAGEWFGIGKWWKKQKIVKNHPVLE
jgi:thiosulfate dehydrogenase (quinone) large subunit